MPRNLFHQIFNAPIGTEWERFGLLRNDLLGQAVGPAPGPQLFVQGIDLRGKPSELVVTVDISADLVARAVRRYGESFGLISVCAIPIGNGRVRCLLGWGST